MMQYRCEGGPADGRTITSEANSFVFPVPLPMNVHHMRQPDLGYEIAEYRREGRVFRWAGVVSNARATMNVSGALLRTVPGSRRLLREMLREQLDALASERKQVVDRIVWVVAYNPSRDIFTVVAFVGGQRSEYAGHLRPVLRAAHRAANSPQEPERE